MRITPRPAGWERAADRRPTAGSGSPRGRAALALLRPGQSLPVPAGSRGTAERRCPRPERPWRRGCVASGRGRAQPPVAAAEAGAAAAAGATAAAAGATAAGAAAARWCRRPAPAWCRRPAREWCRRPAPAWCRRPGPGVVPPPCAGGRRPRSACRCPPSRAEPASWRRRSWSWPSSWTRRGGAPRSGPRPAPCSRQDLQRLGHEVVPDDRREGAALDRLAVEQVRHGHELVGIADPHRGGDVRRPADEPGVAVVLGRARSCRPRRRRRSPPRCRCRG